MTEYNAQVCLILLVPLYYRAEREKYYRHGLKGKKDSDKYLLLVIDGMDQSKHNLPHFNVMTEVGLRYMFKSLLTLE